MPFKGKTNPGEEDTGDVQERSPWVPQGKGNHIAQRGKMAHRRDVKTLGKRSLTQKKKKGGTSHVLKGECGLECGVPLGRTAVGLRKKNKNKPFGLRKEKGRRGKGKRPRGEKHPLAR